MSSTQTTQGARALTEHTYWNPPGLGPRGCRQIGDSSNKC